MFSRFLVIALAATVSGAAYGQSNISSDSPGTPATPQAVEAPKPDLTPEMRGDIFMARKMYREAIEAFREAPPKNAVVLNKIGIAYHQSMELDKAKKSYEQALRYKSDYVEAMNNIGTVYYAQKSFRRAISWYNRALKVAGTEPRAASIYMNLGTAYFARKKYDDATKAYETAVSIDPGVFERRGNYGIMLEERRVEERAKYHFYLSKLNAKMGRTDLALQYLRKALEEGFKERKQLDSPEFTSIRDLPEYKEMLAKEYNVL